MDLTQGTSQEKNSRAKKMMLWFGIISLIMSFAGLTSAYIVSRSSRKDWLYNFDFPNAFIVSLILIILSSLTFILAKRALKASNRLTTSAFLLITLVLGIGFIWSQFIGFSELVNKGYDLTLYGFILIGPSTDITMSYIYIIVIAHIIHLLVGLICLLVVIYNHFKQKYNAEDMLGFELAATFWHFIDILWVYLFLFLYFVR